MSDSSQNLVLEHLRHIHDAVDSLREDARELKHRLSAAELGLAGVRREVAALAEADALLGVRTDRFEDRLERIERRLDILPAG